MDNSYLDMTDYEKYQFVKEQLFRNNYSTKHISPSHSKLLEIIADNNPHIYQRAATDALINISARNQFSNSAMHLVSIEPISLMSKEELLIHLKTEVKGDGEVSVVNETNDVRNLSDFFGIKSSEIFFAKVKGDSMLDAKIESGDTLLLETVNEIHSGAIVVASVNNHIFVKRLKFDADNTYLISENKAYPPFKITKSIDFKIIGVVRGILRRVS